MLKQGEVGMRKDNKKIEVAGSRVVDTLLITSSALLPALLPATSFFMGGRDEVQRRIWICRGKATAREFTRAGRSFICGRGIKA